MRTSLYLLLIAIVLLLLSHVPPSSMIFPPAEMSANYSRRYISIDIGDRLAMNPQGVIDDGIFGKQAFLAKCEGRIRANSHWDDRISLQWVLPETMIMELKMTGPDSGLALVALVDSVTEGYVLYEGPRYYIRFLPADAIFEKRDKK